MMNNLIILFPLLFLSCSYNIYSKQKEKKTIEEIVDHTDKMIATIVDMWNIGR